MNRRSFLKGLGLVAACVVLEPVIEIPRVIYSFPSQIVIRPRGNSLLTPQIITREALKILHANLNFVSRLNDSWERDFGSQIYVKKPQVFA